MRRSDCIGGCDIGVNSDATLPGVFIHGARNSLIDIFLDRGQVLVSNRDMSLIVAARTTRGGWVLKKPPIMNLVANGMSSEEIIEAYPYIEQKDIRQALQQAAWLTEETVHPLELASA